MGGWTNPSIGGGGTLTGDLTITGNLTVQGTTTSIVNQTISGTVIIDVDNTEAFLVRKDGDAADVFIVDTINDRIGILGAPSAALDIHSGSLALLLGADSGATTRTDAADKIARVAVPHYTNAEEAAAILFVQTLSGSNLISFGGGNASLNAATELRFFTAANNTTLSGTQRMTIDSAGDVGIGIAPVTGCQLVLPQENDVVTPTLAFGDGDTGFYEGADDELRVSVGGAARWTFLTSNFQANGTSGPLLIDQTSSTTTVTVIANRTVTNTGLGGVAGEISLITGGAERINISDAGLTMGNNALIARDVNAGLTASTTQTQGQGAFTAEINEISTVANVDDTVTLITASGGIKQTVINNGANQLQIFPASGDDLGQGLDTAVSLAAGSNITFQAYNATKWESV